MSSIHVAPLDSDDLEKHFESIGYKAEILADSIGPNEIRNTTVVLTYPRFVHSELLTHRQLSRNSSSSRAIPVTKMMEQVRNDPAMPVFWGKNQAGMQAIVELDLEEKAAAISEWLAARDLMLASVEKLSGNLKVHKQLANRLLEPWMWITVIVTGTELENLFALRRHKDAQPEIKRIADVWYAAMVASIPKKLKPGEWHLPLVPDYEKLLGEGFTIDQIVRICVGRCARVSYLTYSGIREPQADIDLAVRLEKQGHFSPFEHPAMCLTEHEHQWSGNIRGWLMFRKTLPNEAVFVAPEEKATP